MKQDQKHPGEEEYAFMQEVIKDESDNRNTWKKRCFRMIGLGVIFGIAACIAFFALQPIVREQFSGEPETVTIPEDEVPEEEKEIEVVQEQIEVVDYSQTMQELKQISKVLEKSIVEVTEADINWVELDADGEDVVSGVIVADNGQELLILTEYCGKEKANTVQIKFADESVCEGTFKASEGNLGFCVYAVSKDIISKDTWANIEVAELGSSYMIDIQDTIIAAGKPFGADRAVGYGLITSNKKQVKLADGDYRILTTDIAVYNNGSGIVANMKGEVIGIICGIEEKEGQKRNLTCYAISNVKHAIECLSNGKNVPYIGIYGEDTTKDMSENGMPEGVYIKEVEADSPAMTAGIQTGDIIVCLDDNEIQNYQSYHNILMQCETGRKVMIKVLRSGAEKEYVELEFDVKIGSKE